MAIDVNYLVPGALATVARFQKRYPEIADTRDPIVIQETLIEATADLEAMTSRRLAPFTNTLYENMLYGIYPDEYGDDSSGMPVGIAGSLGISFAEAIGADDLVRHFFLDQFAPQYPELWTYTIESMNIFLTYGNSQPIDVAGGGIIGPEVTSGHCWLRLGTFAPVGTRIQCVYSGGYTLGIPPNLQRACLMHAAQLLVTDATVQNRSDMNLNENREHIDRLIAPWMRY